MTPLTGPWLSEDEVIFHRMEAFHRQRVDAVAAGQSPIDKPEGILVLHVVPRVCVQDTRRFDGAKLKEHGAMFPALGGRVGYTRFNVDGLLSYDGREQVRAYSQLFRDGRLEAAMSEVAFRVNLQQQNSPLCLRDSMCEKAVQQVVGEYLRFCKAIGLTPPFHLFSAIIGCKGVRLCTDMRFRDLSEFAIDRSPAFLPDVVIDSLDAEPVKVLRPWCDTLWQGCGVERSYSFDQAGNWHERR